jgi:hypothetical protein
MPTRPVSTPPDPLRIADCLARWRIDREWLTAFAAEAGYTPERNLRLGRLWLKRFPPAWDDPPHVVNRRAELCRKLGLPLMPQPPEPKGSEFRGRGRPFGRRSVVEPDEKAEIRRETGTIASIARRHSVSSRTVRRIRGLPL